MWIYRDGLYSTTGVSHTTQTLTVQRITKRPAEFLTRQLLPCPLPQLYTQAYAVPEDVHVGDQLTAIFQ